VTSRQARPIDVFKILRKSPIDLKGELFTTAWTFGASALVKLLSSMVLTRLLYPEAFGIITLLFSVVFIVEMMADVGITGLLIRHEDGDKKQFIDTLWSVRLGRACANAILLFIAAPYITDWYGLPEITDALRLFSIWFVLAGLESMSFLLAVRHKNTKILNYTQLVATLVSTIFAISYSYLQRDHMGMVYAALLDRALVSAASYAFYRQSRPKIGFDRDAGWALFHFAKYVIPSSLMTLVIVQFDKVIFLKLFTLELLGVYGLAINVIGPVQSLTSRVCQNVLYPRCAENFRADRSSFVEKYYTDNYKLHAFTILLPAILCGAGSLLIHILYDERYAIAGFVLQLFGMRALIATFASSSEFLLFASGLIRIQFWGNLIRLTWFVPAVLIGYAVAGFQGFVAMAMLEMLPTTLYYYYVQSRSDLMIFRYEMLRVLFALIAIASSASAAWFVSTIISLLHT
jgi:O-antigen/teichoic acid export membrane protein